jgi:Flp pilus assembly protein TadD
MWRLRRVHSAVAFGCWWFLLLLVPSGVLFTLGRGEPMAEHRVYGASIGMFLVAGSAFGVLAHRFDRRGPLWRGLLYGLSALFVMQLGARTMIRNAIWSDPVRLSREAVGLSPDHWMPRLLLAEALRTTGRCAEAIPEYRTAIALRPQEAFGYTKLAACLISAGQLDEAANVFAQLDGVDARSTQASTGLGLIELLRNRPAEARSQFLRTLDRNAADPVASQLVAFVDGTIDREGTAAVCAALASLAPGAGATDTCRSLSLPPGPRP